jgi:hypothetical protein
VHRLEAAEGRLHINPAFLFLRSSIVLLLPPPSPHSLSDQSCGAVASLSYALNHHYSASLALVCSVPIELLRSPRTKLIQPFCPLDIHNTNAFASITQCPPPTIRLLRRRRMEVSLLPITLHLPHIHVMQHFIYATVAQSCDRSLFHLEPIT